MQDLCKKTKRVLNRIWNKCVRIFRGDNTLPPEIRTLKASKLFRARWYCRQYHLHGVNPYQHYLETGWKLGYDPSKEFSTEFYLQENQDVKEAGINPLMHYELYGKNEKSRRTPNELICLLQSSEFFDAAWYKKHYDVPQHMSAELHYHMIGWKKGYNPSSKFSTIRYLLMNPDVRRAVIDPLVHYEEYGKKDAHRKLYRQPLGMDITEEKLKKYHRLQDERISKEYSSNAEKLIVYLVPDFDQICGGMMCICNYPHDIRNFPELQDYARMVATIPSRNTFPDYTKFDAHAHIYRFEQIRAHFPHLKKLILHVPEYQIKNFILNISCEDLAWLSVSDFVTINLMNQNNELMPDPKVVELMRLIVPHMTMTCAHRQYCNEFLRSTYNMPLHFIPADKKIKFHSVPFEEKEELMVISPDEHPAKEKVIGEIERNFPELKIKVVENMSFSKYLELIAKAKWVVSFGEGFDGYTIESLYSDTVSFTMFNDTFFEEEFKRWPNMYEDASAMYENIVCDIKRLNHKDEYNKFLKQVQHCCVEEFSTHQVLQAQPLVSVVLCTYQAQKYLKKQLESIAKQTYSNLELLVYDRGSTDETMSILEQQQFSFPVKIRKSEQFVNKNNAMQELISEAHGEYIALCDQDDIWMPQKIHYLVERIDGFDASFGSVIEIDRKSKEKGNIYHYRENHRNQSRWYQLRDILQPIDAMPDCSLLIRKSAAMQSFPIIDEKIPLSWWCVINTVIAGKGCVYIGKDVAYLREFSVKMENHYASEQSRDESEQKAIVAIIEKYEHILSKKNKKVLHLHLNWLTMHAIFSPYSAGYFEEYMHANHFSFSDSVLEEIAAQFRKIS